MYVWRSRCMSTGYTTTKMGICRHAQSLDFSRPILNARGTKKYNRLGGHSQQIKDMHAVASLNKHNCDFLVIINMANCTITGHGQMPLAKNNTTN